MKRFTPEWVAGRRRGRIWAGGLAAFSTVGAMIVGAINPFMALGLLATGWLLGAGTYLLGAKLLPAPERFTALRVPSVSEPTDAMVHTGEVRERIQRFFLLHADAVASLAWPMAAAALLLPLSLHLFIFMVIVGFGGWFDPENAVGFGAYMTLTSVLLIPAYSTLVLMCRNYARRLVEQNRPPSPEMASARAVGMTVLAACVPGLLLVVPPLMVALTAMLIVPAIFASARAIHVHDTRALVPTERFLLEHYRQETFSVCQSLLQDTLAPHTVRLRALRFVSSEYAPDLVGPALERILNAGPDGMTSALIETCRSIQYRVSMPILYGLAKHGASDTAHLAVKEMVRGHGPPAEPMLIELMWLCDGSVIEAVLDGLGKVGTRESVQAIRQFCEGRTTYLPPHETAARAIKRIQRRLPAAAPGQLSFAVETAGELSLSAPGELSLNPPSSGPSPSAADREDDDRASEK